MIFINDINKQQIQRHKCPLADDYKAQLINQENQ